jgi:hypothetical protein
MTTSGWFADPYGRHEKRFFNGTVWTSDVLDGEQRGSDSIQGQATPSIPDATQTTVTNTQPSTEGWRSPFGSPQAWRDGDELVFRIDTPLPPICVFCGATAVAGIRNAINTRGHPFGNLQILTVRIPVCEDDRRRNRWIMARGNITVVVLFVFLLLGGTLPGLPGLISNAINPFGGTRPGVHAVVLALAVFAVVHVVRRLLRGSRDPRPERLFYDRSRAGFVWLRGADPRCLDQLPPVSAGR